MDDGKLLVGKDLMERAAVLSALMTPDKRRDRRALAELVAATPEGLALLQGIACDVLKSHGVNVTGLQSVIERRPFTIGSSGCCGIYDNDEQGDGKVAVVVTISRQVWLFAPESGRAIVPGEVISRLCLLPGHYGIRGMFDGIDPAHLAARRRDPAWQPE